MAWQRDLIMAGLGVLGGLFLGRKDETAEEEKGNEEITVEFAGLPEDEAEDEYGEGYEIYRGYQLIGGYRPAYDEEGTLEAYALREGQGALFKDFTTSEEAINWVVENNEI